MRSRLTAIAAATVLLAFVAPPAQAASPNTPVLVSPANGSTATGTTIPLSVTASDPDGGTLNVRFEGRKLGATSTGTPFTVVAVPDTQNYTYSGRTAILNQHLQWIADSRAQLNTAMVTELGDLVSTFTADSQWQIISNAFKILDDAGVPNTVVGGNHDFDNTTGAFPLYDTYFPPSRYTSAHWTPSSATYGGYLGQNLFGPDPIDRRNMDNFALFSAGGVDWLILNLEWEAPQYALDWAAKVLDAYPNRLAMISTHAFLAENANRSTITERPGGSPTPPNTIWNTLVKTHCTVRLVLNGHYHNSTGEARRSDLNDCGNTVQQVLSNYQDRPNGGDGWLRIYTFDPVADTMSARTYSTRLAEFETDDNSQFTVPFAIPDPPATFSPIGTASIASGGTATATWTGLDPAATYEWRAVVDDGSATTTSPTWTVSTPGATPTELARDTFTRTAPRWGNAEVGGPWVDSGASYFATDGAYGQVTIARAGSGPSATLGAVSARDVTINTDFALTAPPAGAPFTHTVMARLSGSTYYALNTRLETTGALRLYVSRVVSGVETQLKSIVVNGFGYTAGERLKVRFDVSGNGTTTIEGKAWRASASEPASAMISTTDTTAGLQAAGGVGLKFYTSTGTTSLPTSPSVDGFRVLPVGGTPPVNQPPVAAFSASTKSWQVSVDASASTDDGTITGYAWDYGDGATGTGKTDSHPYAADGTYSVKLTVTDNLGATTSLTKPVTVTNTAPTASFTATPTALALSVDASASTDDGTITGYAWDYGDGATGTGKTDSHTYATDGTYTVKLTVTDNTGKTGTATKQVSVSNQPPVAAFSASTKSWQVSVDASASTDDGTITGYAWDYGDGATGTGKTDSHTYAADGTYSVKLTVTDNLGATTSLTKPVTVTNTAPTASFTATPTALALSVDASASTDDGTITGYAWDYGDGATGTGKTDSHTYAADGTYTVKLTVTDNTGKTGTATKQVSVSKPASSVIASDAFTRTLPSSWGAADTGGAWTITSTTMFAANGSQGLVTIPAAGKGPVAYLNSVSARDVSMVTDFALDKVPTGGAYSHSVLARMSGTSSAYMLTARVNTNGSVQVYLSKLVSGTETQLKSVTLNTFGFAAGDRVKLRLDVSGTGTTTLGGRVWKASGSEPAADQVSITDTTATLQGPGAVGIKAYTSSALTSLPAQVSVAGFRVTAPGA